MARFLWEDHDGNVHIVVKTGESVGPFGDDYVSIKTVDEQRYHTAIARYDSLLPAGTDIH
jgi:hypothetical protein